MLNSDPTDHIVGIDLFYDEKHDLCGLIGVGGSRVIGTPKGGSLWMKG